MDDTVLPSKLLTTLSQAVKIVNGHDFIHVYSHYDADGITAASIIAKTLLRAGKEFKITLFTSLNDENMNTIRSAPSECIMVTDLGASYIEQLDALKCDIIVLDHHTVEKQAKRICYANPHLYGIDGMTSGCGATMAFLFAISMSQGNWDLVQVAFAGIAGDRQHINGLKGLNIYLYEGGLERGYIKVADGSMIPPGQLISELFLSTDPYIAGVSGNADGVAALLDSAGIGREKYNKDLTEEERRKLSSLIALKLMGQGTSMQTMFELTRTRYYLKDWNMDAETLGSLLNGCGRLGLGGIGVSAGMGDTKCLSKAAELENTSKTQIMESVLSLQKNGLNQMKHIQWFDSSELGFTGMVCGIAMQFMGNPSKPTIGINRSGGTAKISSRATFGLLDKGVDLSRALKEACAAVGGSGGGHRIASGGSCPSERSDEFLANLDEIIGEQLRS
ncbi:DHHA1 domain protein [Candidatus Methanoplasma termitum]|uniref:DHHA1 domain protein n=1 Tax=Candidatus Methanoplasma termitum TaxID=1577791 RepID=A0A0A7LCM1_9ARCH|nr:DHH family phosphoesterase [Candidatus Methanoplasma termitum]AIZ56037.1 DHHA1 domain protein [Candidatus Methanoplasma termitum]MCL2333574.1 DHH family phosphoesterase [Candidatus Methanoplasma sp.]